MGAENPALYPHRTGDARLWVGSRCTVLRRSWRRPVRASGSAIRFRTKRVMVMVMSRTGPLILFIRSSRSLAEEVRRTRDAHVRAVS
jgi:hypothetical protein